MYKLTHLALLMWLPLFGVQKTSAKSNFQVYALKHEGEQLCAVEINHLHSVPVCQNATFLAHSLSDNKTFTEKQYLSECPDSWVEQKICVLKAVRTKKVRPNPFITLYNDLFLQPAQQMFFFVHHSLDDLVEDVIALGIPVAAFYLAHLYQLHIAFSIFIVSGVHFFSSPLGDIAGDWIQKYQMGAEGETEIEWHMPEMMANKIEDGIKTFYIAICYEHSLMIRILEARFSPLQTFVTESPQPVSIAYNTFKALLFAHETYQLFERYNWINEIADAIADMFTDLFSQGN